MSGKGRKNVERGSTGFDPKLKDLQCFLNQPNINMVIPWVYKMYKKVVKPETKTTRGSTGFDPRLKDLECFLNQPNINMVIPWVYSIYRAVEEGGAGGDGYNWDDMTLDGSKSEV